MRSVPIVALIVLMVAGSAAAQNRDYLPERRALLTEGTDFPGSDLVPVFDLSFEACEATCLAMPECRAFTYNRRAGSCFPKSGVAEQVPFEGAISGWIRSTSATSRAAAGDRARDLDFLRQEDFDAALRQARGLGAQHPIGNRTEEDFQADARLARAAGDRTAAMQATGAALIFSDAPEGWLDYAEAWLAMPWDREARRRENAERAVASAINGYLRSDSANLRASVLETLARAAEQAGRGRDMIPALRLAQALRPRDDTEALLETALGKYGFRIDETLVESDSAAPRICARFTEELVKAGTDYAPFVRLPESGLTVDVAENRICIGGLTHGSRYAITFRAGLPSSSGEELGRDQTITQYVRDRAPAVRFPGRAYVLPKAGSTGIPVATVNTTALELSLLRLADRNLIRAMQDNLFGRPLDYWSAEQLGNDLAEKVWSAAADVAQDVNREVTTLLPLAEVVQGLGPGIYALQASIPGLDPYENPPATQWFVVSDLGLTTMEGTDGLHVFVRGLSDAAAVDGAVATLVNRANAVIGTVTTDAEGYAHFAPGLTAGTGSSAPALVTVGKGEDMAFLSLSEAEFDLSDRGVAGREAAPPIDVFLSTDRGAYRAGETVNATILARDGRAEAIEGLPMTVRLVRPDGVEYARRLLEPAGAGGFVASLSLAGSAPRGTWRIESFLDETSPLASQSFLVEDFLPERIDFDLRLPEGALRLSDRPVISLDARYLFGAPGAGLAIEGDLRLAAVRALDAFPGYVFGRHDEPFSPYRDSLYDLGETDAEGHADVAVSFPELGDTANRPLEARIAFRLKEGSGRPVERDIIRRILPDAPVIGIRPAFADGTVPQGAEAAFSLIAVGPDEAPAARQVRWTLNRIETSYQWYSLYGDWNWEVTTTRSRVAMGEATLAPDGPVGVSAPVDWGNYEIVVEATDPGYTVSSMAFYAGWYVPADAAETPDRLTVALDKPAYSPGDTARLRIESRVEGIALVTVLSNRLIDMRAVPVMTGENVLDLPVTGDWGAGAYVTASVVRPLGSEAGRAPARALGLSYAPVDPGKRRLAAEFEVASEATPRDTLPVALRVAGAQPGEEVIATIAAVDLGILNLTRFASPDPAGHYFGQRKLGVGIRDIYGRLIDGRTGAPGTLRSGGDAASGLRMQAPPPTEELVAYFSGPLTVGPDGYARTEFQLPGFNGTVRLMAVTWSKTAVGQAETDVLVRDPVVVTASAPRFLAPGDTSRILLEFIHATGPTGRMGLDVTAEGLSLAPVPAGFDLAEGGKTEITVPMIAPDTEGTARVRIALTTPDGRQLIKTLTIPLQSNEPEISRQSRFSLAQGASFTLDANAFAGLLPGSGRATIAAGPIARFDTPGLLAALDAYPYGCTEQLTSKALPLLYFDEVAAAMGAAGGEDIRRRVDTSIAEILLNQAPNGAFGLWYPDAGDLWLDAYVTDFLGRAKARGYAVPESAFRNALDNLRNQINYAPDFDSAGGAYAYALMVLAREGAAAIGDLRYYADVKAAAFDTAIAAAQLGAALAFYGDQRRADEMFAQASRLLGGRIAEVPVWRADFGTRLRDSAALLALASGAGSRIVDTEALGNAVASEMADRRLSTQEAAWALLATHALIDRPGTEGFSVNGQPATGPLVRVLDSAAEDPQVITNGSGREATLTLSTFGVPVEPEPAGGKGYAIARSYYTLDGQPADVAQVRQGTRLVAVIEVTPADGAEARLMVNDPLPAGFEIDNPALLRSGDIAALDWLRTADTRMTEFRQERFLAAVDWTSPEPFRLAYVLRAISPGSFHQPAASVEDMYRPDYRARTAAGLVTVTE